MSHSFAVLALAAALVGCPAEETEDALKTERHTAGTPAESGELTLVPDPLAGDNPLHALERRDVPEAGEPFVDPRFGTVITRVTGEPGVRHEYARHDPFNVDGTRVILLRPEEGEFTVQRTDPLPCDRAENRVLTLDLEEPRWDPKDPHVVWGLDGHSIVAIDCRSGERTLVKDFARDPELGPLIEREPDLYRITTLDEGEPSRDLRYWALLLQGSHDGYRPRHLFTWDRESDEVLGVYGLSREEQIDWVGMSWLGSFVVIGGDLGGGRVSGLTLADRPLTRFHRLAASTAHSDVGLDLDGREVIVMQNSRTDRIDLIPLDWSTTPVAQESDYAGSGCAPLVRLFYEQGSPVGMGAGVHVSCNAPGYAVVSTYLEDGLPERNWIDRSMVVVALDPDAPRAAYLAKVHNTQQTYWEEPHATISNDGSRVLWASNWGRRVGSDEVFLMRLDMPAGWQEQLSSPSR